MKPHTQKCFAKQNSLYICIHLFFSFGIIIKEQGRTKAPKFSSSADSKRPGPNQSRQPDPGTGEGWGGSIGKKPAYPSLYPPGSRKDPVCLGSALRECWEITASEPQSLQGALSPFPAALHPRPSRADCIVKYSSNQANIWAALSPLRVFLII